MVLLIGTTISAFLGTYLFIRTGLWSVINSFLLTVGKAINTLNNPLLNDDEKIRISRQFSLTILKKLGLILLGLGGILIISLSPLIYIDLARYSKLEIFSYIGIAVILASSAYFLLLPQKQDSDFHYSPAKQLFYYLTLGALPVQNLALHLQRFFLPGNEQIQKGMVVTGLARSGTTVLLNYLAFSPELKYFTYRDMPFLFGRRLWRLLNRKQVEKTERIHADGIQVNLDSAEAFDEYIWDRVLKNKFYRGKALTIHDLKEDEIHQFEKIVSAQFQGELNYLTKNNNFILRLKAFLDLRKNYLVVIVFRHPIAHAKSLKFQHLHISKKQEEEPFIMDYMDWLGHHEFGQNRKDFKLVKAGFEYHDPYDLNYWLERWIDYYNYALEFRDRQVCFVNNSQIAQNPGITTEKILKRAGLKRLTNTNFPQKFFEERENAGDCNPALKAKALELFERLKSIELQGH